eukprot:1151243-Pelagomonas_calceolata.AAC.7
MALRRMSSRQACMPVKFGQCPIFNNSFTQVNGTWRVAVFGLLLIKERQYLGEALASLLVRGPFLNARSQTWTA